MATTDPLPSSAACPRCGAPIPRDAEGDPDGVRRVATGEWYCSEPCIEADERGPVSAARPTREYVVRDYDQIVYRGTDRERALAAWDAAGVPDCWVIECRTYPEALRSTAQESAQ